MTKTKWKETLKPHRSGQDRKRKEAKEKEKVKRTVNAFYVGRRATIRPSAPTVGMSLKPNGALGRVPFHSKREKGKGKDQGEGGKGKK